jgi:hypothetical protein
VNDSVTTEMKKLAKAKVVCPRCESRPNQACSSVTTGEDADMHASRYYPLMTAYTMGMEDASSEVAPSA